jgi:hypothetical protein
MRQPFTHLRLARESLSATYTFTHTLYTPFFSSFSWEEKKRGGGEARPQRCTGCTIHPHFDSLDELCTRKTIATPARTQ